MLSGVMVAELMTMKGPEARADASWIVRATSSLPDARRAGDQHARIGGATRSITWRNWLIAARLADDAC